MCTSLSHQRLQTIIITMPPITHMVQASSCFPFSFGRAKSTSLVATHFAARSRSPTVEMEHAEFLSGQINGDGKCKLRIERKFQRLERLQNAQSKR